MCRVQDGWQVMKFIFSFTLNYTYKFSLCSNGTGLVLACEDKSDDSIQLHFCLQDSVDSTICSLLVIIPRFFILLASVYVFTSSGKSLLKPKPWIFPETPTKSLLGEPGRHNGNSFITFFNTTMAKSCCVLVVILSTSLYSSLYSSQSTFLRSLGTCPHCSPGLKVQGVPGIQGSGRSDAGVKVGKRWLSSFPTSAFTLCLSILDSIMKTNFTYFHPLDKSKMTPFNKMFLFFITHPKRS